MDRKTPNNHYKQTFRSGWPSRVRAGERLPSCRLCDEKVAGFDPWYCSTHSDQERKAYMEHWRSK